MSTMRKVFKGLILLFWMAVIYGFSSQNGQLSQATSDGLMGSIYQMLPFMEIIPAAFLSIFIRKVAHFSEFFILACLFYSFLKEFKLSHLTLTSFILTALYACFDETHQLFVSGRSFQLWDMLIDSLGGLVAVSVCHFLLNKEKY